MSGNFEKFTANYSHSLIREITECGSKKLSDWDVYGKLFALRDFVESLDVDLINCWIEKFTANYSHSMFRRITGCGSKNCRTEKFTANYSYSLIRGGKKSWLILQFRRMFIFIVIAAKSLLLRFQYSQYAT